MTIPQILEQQNITFKPSSNGWIQILCPFCKREKPKLFIQEISGNYHCFLCGIGGRFASLQEKLGVSPSTELVLQPPPEDFDPPPMDKEIVQEHHDRLLQTAPIVEYLEQKRGYTVETAKKFLLGWDGRNLVIPILDANGELVNMKFRRDPTLPSASKRMWQVAGQGKKRLFNEIVLRAKTKKDQERIIICEGEPDCMLLAQHGYAAVTSTGGAMSFDESWVDSFSVFDKVYLCFDNDRNSVGQTATIRTAQMFLKKGIRVFIISLPPPNVHESKIDVTDFFIKRKKSKADFTLLLKEAQEYTGKPLARETYSFLSGADIYDLDFPKDQWLVEHFIPLESICCVAGLPGSMKSYFSNYIAACVAAGTPVLGKYSTTTSPVLFIDKENRLSRLQTRFKSLETPRETMANIHFLRGDFLVEKPDSIAVVEDMIIRKKIKLTIIDTLVRIHSKAENDASEMNKIFHVLRRLREAGSSVLFLHHFNKRGSGIYQTKDVRELLRGSGDILAQLDTYFALQIVEGGFIRVEFGKSRDETLIKPFLMEAAFLSDKVYFNYFKEATDEDGEKFRQVLLRDEILKEIAKHKRLDRGSLMTTFTAHASVSTIDRCLKELKASGDIASQGAGHTGTSYIVIDKTREEPTESLL